LAFYLGILYKYIEDRGMDNSALLSLILILIVGYLVLYFGGRKYLEHFENKVENVITKHHSPKHKLPGTPYLQNPINDIDDYEVSSVFHNQGSRSVSKKEISDAMSMYPLDWSVQGQNSQHFQENQDEFKKKMKTMQPVAYDGEQLETPLADYMMQDEEEKKILQTYKPESSKGLLSYSIHDVKKLLKQIYDPKGLIPVVKKSKQAENVWEVIEVKEKNPTIVWEDELPGKIKRDRGEDVIRVPYTASDISAGMDPFFQGNPSARIGKHDYTQFTPGLERMFAPTFPVKSWF